jgi:aminopeptidase N
MNRVRPVVALLLALAILDVLAASAPGAVPVHHDIDLRLWPETGRLEAVDRIELQGFPEIEVTLAPGLAVQRARLDGRSVPVRGQNGSWRIEGEAREGKVLTLEYGGRLEGADGRAAPFLESEGGFLPAGSSWLPLADEGLVTFELALEVPQPFKAVATGALVNEAADADVYRARFAQTRAGEAPSVLVGPYVITEQRAGDVRLRTYFYEDDPALARRYLSQAAAYIALYERWVGDYPFADFHIVAAPLPLGLGFPGLTYVSRRILRLPFMRTTSLAHEILHSWWGGAIEVAYEEGNWAEGLTTYMADYAIAEHDSAARAREMRLAWLRDFAALPPERDVALVDFVAKRHAAAQVIGYNKAAFIFHMLRKLAGDGVFQQALQLFWRRHRFETASWADLQGSFEAVLDQDLSWFFQQWLERPGAPRLHLEDVSAHPTMSGYELEMTLRRDPPWYRLSVPVAVETQGGIVEMEVQLAGPRATARIELDARPLALTVDPDYDVFRRLAPGGSGPDPARPHFEE